MQSSVQILMDLTLVFVRPVSSLNWECLHKRHFNKMLITRMLYQTPYRRIVTKCDVVSIYFVLGYTGKNCDSVTNPCLGYTCYFGGTCEVINNTPHCLCLSDYMGLRCEAIIRQCNYSYPCKNNALCQNKDLGWHKKSFRS